MTVSPDPRQPGHMRVGDADRGIVADLLSAAYAEGRLTRDEHGTRLEQAMAARTFDDLRGLTADLVPATNTGRTIGAFSSSGSAQIDRTAGSSEADTSFAIFGGVERKGPWHVRRHVSNITLFGGAEFDLRDATFESDVVEMNLFCAFGGVDITVPEGVNVRNETVAIFGGTSVSRVHPVPGAPTVVLKGLVLFGGVDAKGPRTKKRDR
ncbi:DUF1707 domain-containing protein [Propioniciclava soli]|uniref:DUF1707 SHOCT-like domain-containing protein n=1 Tax=Propioniciclava soli TaxID=2775081 RepID=UPI001E64873B|nr:DUF1707 domain-containing protein [Propioniciclava soli]